MAVVFQLVYKIIVETIMNRKRLISNKRQHEIIKKKKHDQKISYIFNLKIIRVQLFSKASQLTKDTHFISCNYRWNMGGGKQKIKTITVMFFILIT